MSLEEMGIMMNSVNMLIEISGTSLIFYNNCVYCRFTTQNQKRNHLSNVTKFKY